MAPPIVFISYSHKDESEKDALLTHMGVIQHANLIEVWNDDLISAGDDWKREISHAINQAQIAILLISANFLNSRFSIEREVPALLKRRQSQGLVVFPVIAKACAWEKVDWLAEMNVRPKNGRPVWSDIGSHVDEDLANIVKEVADTVQVTTSAYESISTDPNIKPNQIDPTASAAAPLVIEPPYGTMRLDSNFYVERIADNHCLKLFSENYAVTLFVQAPRQMGKSSLMRRILDQVERQFGRQSAFIDFQKFPEQYLSDERKFLPEFCLMISDSLRITEAINRYWQDQRTGISNCSRYLSEYIIPEAKEPFILAMDEVGRILRSPFRNDFFGMLRTWHNDRIDKNFANMSLFFSSAIAPYQLIASPYQSPFNVAEQIQLQDFTTAEVEELNRRHQSPLSRGELVDLMLLVGGHPFLIRLALYQLATKKYDFAALLNQATADAGPFGPHLVSNLGPILEKLDLMRALIRILRDHSHPEDRSFQQLRELGIVRRDGGQVILRNNLYIRYFEERLHHAFEA